MRVFPRIALLLPLFGGAFGVSAEPPALPPPEAVVTRQAVVDLVTHTIKSWETGDAETFLSTFTEDAIFAYAGGRVAKPELSAMFADLQARKKDIKVYIGPFIVVGGEFALRYQFACTDRQSGKRQAVGTGVRGSIRNGRISLFKEYWDAHIAVDQAKGDLPLDEGDPNFPAPSSYLMGPERIN